MASATITLQSACAGGDHLVVRLTVGANNFDFQYTMDEMRDTITAEERRAATSIIARFHCQGMTKAQARAELESPGISVSTA